MYSFAILVIFWKICNILHNLCNYFSACGVTFKSSVAMFYENTYHGVAFYLRFYIIGLLFCDFCNSVVKIEYNSI